MVKLAETVVTRESLTLTVLSHKTDPLGTKPYDIVLPRLTEHPDLCPVLAYERWCSAAHPRGGDPSWPMFYCPAMSSRNQIPTYRSWMAELRKMLQPFVTSTKEYGTHSFRATFETLGLRAGISQADLSAIAIWAPGSVIPANYERPSPEQLLNVTRRLALYIASQ